MLPDDASLKAGKNVLMFKKNIGTFFLFVFTFREKRLGVFLSAS